MPINIPDPDKPLNIPKSLSKGNLEEDKGTDLGNISDPLGSVKNIASTFTKPKGFEESKKIINLSKKYSLPERFVSNNLEEVEARDSAVQKAREPNSSVKNFMDISENHAGLVKDDLNPLNLVSDYAGYLVDKGKMGVIESNLGDIGWEGAWNAAWGQPAFTSEQQSKLEEGEKELRGYYDQYGEIQYFGGWIGEPVRYVPLAVDGIIEGLKWGGVGAAAGAVIGGVVGAAVGTLGSPAGTIAGGIKGAVVGAGWLGGKAFGLGFAYNMVKKEGGHAFRDYLKLTTPDGKQIDQITAGQMAIVAGVLSGSLDYFSFMKIAGNFKFLKPFKNKAAIGKMIVNNPKYLNAIKTIFSSALVEAGTETLQDYIKEVIGNLGVLGQSEKVTMDQVFDALTDVDVKQLAKSGFVGFQAGFGVSGAGVTTSTIAESARVKKVEKQLKEREETNKKRIKEIEGIEAKLQKNTDKINKLKSEIEVTEDVKAKAEKVKEIDKLKDETILRGKAKKLLEDMEKDGSIAPKDKETLVVAPTSKTVSEKVKAKAEMDKKVLAITTKEYEDHIKDDVTKAENIISDVNVLEGLAEAASKAKVSEEPEFMQEFMQKVKEQHNLPGTVQMPVDKFREHFIEQDVDPQVAANDLGVDTQLYLDAEWATGDISIPIDAFIAKGLLSTDKAFFLKNTRMEEGGMTFEEANNFQGEYMSEEGARKIAEEIVKKKEAKDIKKILKKQPDSAFATQLDKMNPEEKGVWRNTIKRFNKKADEIMVKQHKEVKERVEKGIVNDTRKRIKAEREAMPANQLKNAIKKGVASKEKGVGNIKLKPFNRESLVAIYGEDVVKQLPKWAVTDKGGTDINAATLSNAIFGFKNADEMINALVEFNKLPTIKEEVDAQTKWLTKLDDETVAEEVFSTEERLQLVEKELDIINKDLQRIERKHKRSKMYIKPLSKKAIKEDALYRLSNTPINEIKPKSHFNQIIREAKKSEQNIAKGKFKEALSSKQNELQANVMYSVANKVLPKAKKNIAILKNLAKDKNRKVLGERAFYQIKALAIRHGLEESQTIPKMSLGEFRDEYREYFYDIHIPEHLLDEENVKHFSEMTPDEIQELANTARHIAQIGRSEKQLTLRHKEELVNKVADELSKSLIASKNDIGTFHKAVRGVWGIVRGKKARERQLVDPKEKSDFEKLTKDIIINLLTPTGLMRKLDNYKNNGAMKRFFINPVHEAFEVKFRMNEKTRKFLKENVFKDSDKRIKLPFKIKTRSGREIDTITRENLIMMARNWGNEQNIIALYEGLGISREQAFEILKLLPKEDWIKIQKDWDYLDTFKDPIAKLELEDKGFAPEMVTGDEFTIHGEKFNGGYFPIVVDGQNQQTTAFDSETPTHIYASSARTKDNHTRQREGTGKNPLQLTYDAYANHLAAVSHDLAFRKVVKDIQKMLNNAQFKDTLFDTAGKATYEYIRSWNRDIAKGSIQNMPGNFLEKGAKFFRQKLPAVYLGNNIGTISAQVFGAFSSAAQVGIPNLIRGFRYFSRDPFNNLKFVFDHSPYMKERITTGGDQTLYDAIKDAKGISGGFIKLGFAGIMVTDGFVSLPTWYAAYIEAFEGNVDGIPLGSVKDAVRHADDIVDRTQGSGGVERTAGVQRAGEYGKLLTAFQSYFLAVFGQYDESIRKSSKQVTIKNLPAVAYNFLRLHMIYMLGNNAEEYYRGNIPDPRDPEFEKEMYKIAAKTYTNTVPGLRNAAALLFEGIPATLSPVTGALASIPKSAQHIYEFGKEYIIPEVDVEGLLDTGDEHPLGVKKEVGKHQRVVRDFATAISILTGLPLLNPSKYAVNLYDVLAENPNAVTDKEGFERALALYYMVALDHASQWRYKKRKASEKRIRRKEAFDLD